MCMTVYDVSVVQVDAFFEGSLIIKKKNNKKNGFADLIIILTTEHLLLFFVSFYFIFKINFFYSSAINLRKGLEK